jgi:hypothetical protein
MGATWHHTTTIYGPLFTWLSRLVASAASSAHVAELAFRVGAAAAMVAIVLVLYVARAPAAAIIVAGWSPLFALHFAGGGHNDSLMMLFAVAALALGRRRSKLAAVLWIAAIAVKWVAVALLAVDLFARRRRERLRFARDLVAAGVIGVILASIEYGSAWFDAIGGLSSQSHRTSTLGPAGWLHDAGLGHREILAALGLALVILGAALAAAAFVRGRRHPSILGTGTAALQGWLNPWYPAWGGATVAFDDAPVAATVLTLALSAVVLRDALPL